MNKKDPKKTDNSTPIPVKPVAPMPVQPTPVAPTPVVAKPVQPPVQPVPVQPVSAKPTPVVPVKPTPVAPVPIKPTPGAPIPIPPGSATPVVPMPAKAQPVVPAPVAPVKPTPVKSTQKNPAPAAPTPAAPSTVSPQVVRPTPVAATSASPVPVVGAARPIPIAAPTPEDELTLLGAEKDEKEENLDAEADVERLKKVAPPWMISTIVHIVIILIAGFWLMASGPKPPVEFVATFAEVEGEQLDDAVDLFTEEDMEIEDDSFLDEVVLDPVDDPLSSPLEMLADLNPTGMSPSFTAPTVGVALNGRTPGMKKGLLKAYGGTKETETAVTSGLIWLKRNMNKSTGGWSLKGPYDDGGTEENEIAATAMAVLAFQGAGHTTLEGDFKPELNRAWRFLLSRQSESGLFELPTSAVHNHAFYTHGQATIALCELFALTRDDRFREPAQKAVDYLLKTQADTGGWRYKPKEPGDVSVTGWGVMALQSARMAGLEVPESDLDKVSGFLDAMSTEDKSQFGYQGPGAPTPTMTAEGLLCRQYLGWAHDEPALLKGTKHISENPIQWRTPNVYYWYYATQVLHHMEGSLWEDWNKVMRVEIPAHQVQKGSEAGSWHDSKDSWSLHGGRLYSTCLSLYMLEVYYRHLPLYNSVYAK